MLHIVQARRLHASWNISNLRMLQASKLKMDPSFPAREVDATLKTIHFTTVENLFYEIETAIGDALVVKYVSHESFNRLQEVWGKRGRLNLYNEGSQHLVITIPTGPHEQLHSWLYYNQVYSQLCSMGLAHSWINRNHETYYSGGSSAEGDSCGGPLPDRGSPGSFPTLMVEASCSTSIEYLRMKAQWWFDTSNHNIKIVLLAKLDRNRRTIVLERWEESATICGASGWEASCHQAITITESSTNPPIYQATGDLALSFRLLFLRDPRDGENDVVIPVSQLQRYAAVVWGQFGD